MNTIINLSALAQTSRDSSIPATMIGCLNDNLAIQWSSIDAFAKLHATYAPRSSVSSLLCCGMFGRLAYSSLWVISQINWSQITDYKIGKTTTLQFLKQLLEILSFLKDADFSQQTKSQVFANKDQLISLAQVQSLENLTDQDVALALLEQAWLSRITFSQESKAKTQYFFEQNSEDAVYIISNTNEMDCKASLRYLRETCPQLSWRSDEDLNKDMNASDEPSIDGIRLTTDGRVKLCVSFLQKAYKSGVVHETNMSTNVLLKNLMEAAKLDPVQTKMISQWQGDLNMAHTLSIKDITPSKLTWSNR